MRRLFARLGAALVKIADRTDDPVLVTHHAAEAYCKRIESLQEPSHVQKLGARAALVQAWRDRNLVYVGSDKADPDTPAHIYAMPDPVQDGRIVWALVKMVDQPVMVSVASQPLWADYDGRFSYVGNVTTEWR